MCNALKDHVAKVEENIHRGKLLTLFSLFLYFVRDGRTEEPALHLQLGHVTFADVR